MTRGFSPEKYIKAQRAKILERVAKFGRLYLEFGGKLSHDGHASRVLPGYRKNTKIELLKSLGDMTLIYCINAKDLESTRRLGDFHLTYAEQTLKDLDDAQKYGILIGTFVITRFEGEKKAKEFAKELRGLEKKVYFHKEINGYPEDLDKVIRGYSQQPYINIPEDKKLIVISGPAGNSGKMAVALSQIYHEHKKGIITGFAKFETFPIWNLPIDHPVNIAYEAATADLRDENVIDPYHLKAYGKEAVNYNRDIENFGILKAIFKKVGIDYQSPTDMGVNMAKEGIIDDETCRKVAIEEIKSREIRYQKEFDEGRETQKTLDRMKKILKKI